MKRQIKEDLRKKDLGALQKLLEDKQKEVIKLVVEKKLGRSKNPYSTHKKRIEIAILKTIMMEKGKEKEEK